MQVTSSVKRIADSLGTAAAVLAISGAASAAGWVAIHSVGASSAATPENPVQELSAEQAEALERLDAAFGGGWVPAAPDTAAGEAIPRTLFFRLEDAPAEASDSSQRWPELVTLRGAGVVAPLYDAPSGELVGYLVPQLGYLSRELAQSGSFDATAERVSRFGCDTLEEACARSVFGAGVPGGEG